MRPSKLTYYADFVVYPAVIVGLAAAGLAQGAWYNRAEWLCAEVTGFVIWSLAEYILKLFRSYAQLPWSKHWTCSAIFTISPNTRRCHNTSLSRPFTTSPKPWLLSDM